MGGVLKLVGSCRIVRQVHQSIFPSIPKVYPISSRDLCVRVKIMAQRSITSFFKVSPPKPVVAEKVDDDDKKVNGDDKVKSPVKNGKVKVNT